ncbi:MAG: ABC transporter ATP-binding protein [Planctomycetes bacterium]|jgi:putative ABC transport system ATP-binding protein|nr:ABC transporter ATP-binding protein [Planctomycetota bacterium]
MELLQVENLVKDYVSPEGEVQRVLSIDRFALDSGEQVAIKGSSGSGKTTFLHIVAGILAADSGRVCFDGNEITHLSESRRDQYRARELGYVFQSFHLLGAYSALENVTLGAAFGSGGDPDLARELLETLGLGHRLQHRPHQLSIGQQQRVALARALAGRPRMVLADEPTGNLDSTHAQEALELLCSLCRKQGAALLLVSHDPTVLAAFDRQEDFAVLNGAVKEVTL